MRKGKSVLYQRSIFLAVIFLVSFFTIFAYQIPKKAYAASFYWKGGAGGDPNNWSNANNWSATSGGAGGAGIPGSSDDAIFDAATSATNCNLTASVAVGSITNINTGGYNGTLSISSYTLTVSGDFDWERGNLTATSGALNVGGDFLTYSFTAGTSTVTLSGENKLFAPSCRTFYDLVVNSDMSGPGCFTISHNFTISTGKTVTTTSANWNVIGNGATFVIDGTMAGVGLLELDDPTGSTISGSGNLNLPVDFRTVTTNITIPARTYGDRIQVVNYSNSDYAATLGTAPGQTITCGGFAVTNRYLPYHQGAGDIAVLGDTYNPDMVITGNLTISGTGSGSRTLSMGSGDWTIGGSVNVAGGILTNVNGKITLNGTDTYDWNALGTGIDSNVYSMVVWNNKLVIGTNWMETAGGVPANGVAAWDGYSWSALGDGINGDVYALAVYNGDLIAAGYIDGSGLDTMYGPLRWDVATSKWIELGTWSAPYDFSAMIVYNGLLYVGGDFTNAAGVPADGVATWDGANWAGVGTGLVVTPYSDIVNALTVYNGHIVAAGSFDTAHGSVADWIAYFDGANWQNMGDMGPGFFSLWSSIFSLLVKDGNLYIGGVLGKTDYLSSSQPVGVWDGANWSILGDGQTYGVGFSLLDFNDEIYVGSAVSSPGGIAGIGGITNWNGSNWLPFGKDNDYSMLNFSVLSEYNNELYAGGPYSRMGTGSAYFIARYSKPSVTAGSNTLKDLTISNPQTTPITFNDDLTITGTFADNTPDSVLDFHSGSTYTFPVIDIDGTSGHPIIMEGTSSSAWNFDVAVSPSVSYVTPSYSNASGGSEILANDGTSTDGGNNVHWLFGGSPPIVVDHVIVTPPSATVAIGETQTFTAKAYDAGNVEIPGKTFTWSVVAGGGSIDSSSGVFTAGSTPGTYTNTVQATTDGVNGFAIVIVSSTPPPPPPTPPTPPSPPPADGRGGGEEGLPTPSQLVAAAKAATALDNITDDSNSDRYLLSNNTTPEVYGHYPIFSGTAEPTTKLTIKVIEDKSGAEVVNDTFYSGSDGNWHYQTKKYLEDGGYQVSISETEGTSSPWYKFVVKTNASEQVSQIGQDVRVSFKDIINALKESNSNLLNIILLIITAILMINGLINAFSSFFSAEIAARQYFLAFFNSFFVVGGRREKIGFVFDSASRKKIKGALVSLFKSGMLKLLGTALTDKNGRYVFSVDKGEYTLLVKKSGYIFPSQYRVQASENYYGQQLTYNQNLSVIKEIIPIDPTNNAVRKESVYFKIYVAIFTSAAIRWVVLLAGTLIAIFALLINTTNVNFVILGCYVFLFVWEFILQHKESTYCRVVDAANGKPVDLALIRIYNQAGKLCQTYVTDRQGRVNPYTEEHNCVLVVERVGYQKTEQYASTPGAILSRKIYLKPA